VRTGAAHPVCARITHENSRQGVQPLEQRWVATAIVTRIDELFAIDAEARRQALSLEARHALPQQQSGTFNLRQLSTTARIAPIFGPAWFS
jgi:hypothetical protein